MTPLTFEFPITFFNFLTLPVWLWPFLSELLCIVYSLLCFSLPKGLPRLARQASYISLHFLVLCLLMPLRLWALLSSISILFLAQFTSCKVLYIPMVLVKIIIIIINSFVLHFYILIQANMYFWAMQILFLDFKPLNHV